MCVAAAPPLAEQQQALEKKDEDEEEEMGELGKDVVVKEVKESPPPPEPEDNACFKSPAQKVDQLPPGRRRNNGEVARQKDASTPPPPNTANTPPRKTSKSTPKKTATDEGDEFLEEEIIDGFAIVSFRSAEDLAVGATAVYSPVCVGSLRRRPLPSRALLFIVCASARNCQYPSDYPFLTAAAAVLRPLLTYVCVCMRSRRATTIDQFLKSAVASRAPSRYRFANTFLFLVLFF